MNIEKSNFKKLTYLCMQTLTNFPYIEEDFDAITNYQLLCKVVEYLNKVIANENNQNEAINELAEAFINLKNYVDNLDLQDEVNNKLDEMYENGQLSDLVAQYLGLAGMITFDTVADMKQAKNLVNGSKCCTLGYNTVNDGGNSFYKIRTVTNEDTIDEAFIIALNDNLLIAELIVENNEVNVKQMGATGNGITDDTTNMQKAFSSDYNVYIPEGTYIVSSSLNMPFNKNIRGENRSKSILLGTVINDYIIKYGASYDYNGYKGIIENIALKSNNELANKSYGIFLNSGVTIKNCDFITLSRAINRVANYEDLITLKNIYFGNCVPNNYYVVNLQGNGDAYNLNQLKFESYDGDTTQYNGINISACHGGEISNSILNCELYFYNVSAFSVNNCHMENLGKSIRIKDSYINFNNCFKFKNKVGSNNDIILETSNYALFNKVSLNNFLFDTNGLSYGETFANEINEIPVNTVLKLKDVYRIINFADVGTTTHITTGIFITNNNNFNQLSGYYSKESTITRDKIFANNYYDLKVLPSNFGGITKNGNIKWLAEDTAELHYRGVIVCDDTRKIATSYTSDTSIQSLVNNGEGVGIVVNNDNLAKDMILYRGTTLNQYTSKCHIPNVANTRLYDNGINVNGCVWESTTAGNGYGEYNIAEKFEKIGDNVIMYASAHPTTKGTWTKGDIVKNTNITSGQDISWIYDGTNWISQGTY